MCSSSLLIFCSCSTMPRLTIRYQPLPASPSLNYASCERLLPTYQGAGLSTESVYEALFLRGLFLFCSSPCHVNILIFFFPVYRLTAQSTKLPAGYGSFISAQGMSLYSEGNMTRRMMMEKTHWKTLEPQQKKRWSYYSSLH